MKALLPAAAVLTCWQVLAPAARALPDESVRWHRLDAPGVTAYTDGDPDAAGALLEELLRFRAVLESVLPGGPPPDGRPLVVHLFAGPSSFGPYKPLVEGHVSSAAGFFLPRREGAFVALELSRRSGTRIVKHELVHHRLHRLLGGAPSWLDEGLAEYLAASRFEGGVLVLGEPIGEHVGRLRTGGLLPLEKFLRTEAFAAAHSPGAHARRLYAQSWALVHWLRTGGEAPRALFDRQVEELRARGGQARGLVELSGLTAEQLSALVEAHVTAESLPLEALPAAEVPSLRSTRRGLDRGEALSALGELSFAVGRDRSAREHFEAARRARPSFGRAWRGLALLLDAEGLPEGARPLHEAAAERAPDDPEVLLSLGRNLLGLTAPIFDAGAVPEADAARARAVLRRAVHHAPNRAESLAALGLAGLLLTTKGADAETGAALETAAELLPHRSEVAYHYLLWRLRRGELAEATALLRHSVLPREPADSELAVRARNLVTTATLERVRELVRRGHAEEGLRLLDEHLAAGVHEALLPQAQELRRTLR